MSKKSIKALLEELNDCNRELERFTEKSEKIETYRKVAKPSFATRLQRIQGYAKNVHTSLCWSCSCKNTHRTSLQLEPRANLYASRTKTSNTTKTCFTVSFSSLEVDNGVPWAWQAATINVEEDDAGLTPMSSPKPRLVDVPRAVAAASRRNYINCSSTLTLLISAECRRVCHSAHLHLTPFQILWPIHHNHCKK